MVAFAVQTLLLMGAAYFVGAALACLIRRSLAQSAYQTAERRVDRLPEVVQHNAQSAALARAATAARPSPPPAPQPVAAPARAPALDNSPQDLKRIRLIDAALEAELNRQGIGRYDQIAGWMRSDVRRIAKALGIGGRINQENWIEQAQILSRGGDTRFSREFDRRAHGDGQRPIKLADAIREQQAKTAAASTDPAEPAQRHDPDPATKPSL